MDVLSEVLRVVRLSGAVHFIGEFSEPWAFETSPPQMAAARLKVPEGSVTPFHVCMEGRCTVVSGGLPPMLIEADDVIVFPRGDQHLMIRGGEDRAGPDPPDLFAAVHGADHGPEARRRRRFPASSAAICSRTSSSIRCSVRCRRCSASAPAEVRCGWKPTTRAASKVYLIDQPRELEWWSASVRFLIGETAAPGPGNRAVLARLAKSLFVQLLRWLFQHSVRGHGWLAGLHDPQVGRVLSLLHALPDRSWTVDELAREVGSSRATLARRFLELVGQSPIQYLASWRMHLARDLLRETTLGVGEVAGRIGYKSEAAFNRAFRRAVGVPPAAWRLSKLAPGSVKSGRATAPLAGAQ